MVDVRFPSKVCDKGTAEVNEFEQYAAELKERCRQRRLAREYAKREADWLLKTAFRRRWGKCTK